MDKVRKLSAEILTRIIKKRAYSGVELDKALFDSDMEVRDRAFLTELVYGTLKRLMTIDHIIQKHSKIKLSKMEDAVLSNIRIAVYQICYLDRIPDHAAVDEAVNIVRASSKRAVPFTNGVLRNIVRDEDRLNFSDDPDGLSLKYSVPLWIVKLLDGQYLGKTEGILKGLDRNPKTVIRVNTLKITPMEYIKLLDEKEIGYSVPGYPKEFIALDNAGSVRDLPGFKEGYISVQNISAGFVSRAFINEEGKRYLDICAAPGGKSAYLSEIKKDRTEITAADIYEKKLRTIESNMKRLGITSVKTILKDASVTDTSMTESYDGIICDVPCSGLGIMAGKPEIRYAMTPKDIDNIRMLQEKILENAGRYLKTGGLLVYSTCTLNKAENEIQVENFLKKHSEFSLEEFPEKESLPDNTICKEGMLTILPEGIYDGFFLALLRKNK